MLDWTTTYILGGGLSAKAAPIGRYRERGYVLGLNQAAVYRVCDGMLCADRGVAKDCQGTFVWYGAEAHVVFQWNAQVKEAISPEATYWTRTKDGWPSEEPGMIGVGPGQANTMVAAMNVAFQRGAKTIILLGCDFDEANAHWYPCPFKRSEGVWPPRMRVTTVMANLVAMALWLAERACVVYNASPGSLLAGIPVISHEEACHV